MEKQTKGKAANKPGKRKNESAEEPEQKVNRPKRERKAKQFLTLGAETKWTTEDKEKLIDALYRHSPSAVESISHVIGTKTPKEVEEFISKTVNSACLDYRERKVRVDPEKGVAPLELWLSLTQELVKGTRREDYSTSYSEVLNVIARHESLPEESGFPNLNWTNLYRYVSDIIGDKAVLQKLTDMESLVILDMMHNLGETLHSSDTQEQRKLLDLKYQLFKQQASSLVSKQDFTVGLKAFNNDFRDVEYMPSSASSSSSTAPTTTVAASAGPTSSTASPPQQDPSSRTLSTPDLSQSNSPDSVYLPSTSDGAPKVPTPHSPQAGSASTSVHPSSMATHPLHLSVSPEPSSSTDKPTTSVSHKTNSTTNTNPSSSSTNDNDKTSSATVTVTNSSHFRPSTSAMSPKPEPEPSSSTPGPTVLMSLGTNTTINPSSSSTNAETSATVTVTNSSHFRPSTSAVSPEPEPSSSSTGDTASMSLGTNTTPNPSSSSTNDNDKTPSASVTVTNSSHFRPSTSAMSPRPEPEPSSSTAGDTVSLSLGTNTTTTTTTNPSSSSTNAITSSVTVTNRSDFRPSTSAMSSKPKRENDSDEDEDVFNLPRFYSLNPLTIPAHLLAFKPKASEDKEVPVIIGMD